MKNTLKMVVNHFFIITTCVMAVIGFSNLFASDFAGYPKEFPLHTMLVGATSALPSFLFYFRKEPTRKQFIIRMIIHFFCIQTVVLVEGHFLGWYHSFGGMAIICGMITLVYLIVWLVTVRSDNKAEQGINKALKNYNREEE